jgi:hypothetical protein
MMDGMRGMMNGDVAVVARRTALRRPARMMGEGGMGGDPKQQAELMAMRGEMMKAMREIMLKYAQRMQRAK